LIVAGRLFDSCSINFYASVNKLCQEWKHGTLSSNLSSNKKLLSKLPQ
jgi:hypothetical protein